MSAVVKQSLVSLALQSKEQSHRQVTIQTICLSPQLEVGTLQLPRDLRQPGKMLYKFLVKHFSPRETKVSAEYNAAFIYMYLFLNTCHQLDMFSVVFYVTDRATPTTKLQL